MLIELAVCLVLFVVEGIAWCLRPIVVPRAINAWARREGLELESCEYRWLASPASSDAGPLTEADHNVYRVVVRTPGGRTRRADVTADRRLFVFGRIADVDWLD